MVYRLNNTTCIVCGGQENFKEKFTEEHLPPQGLFPESARNDLLVVNACRTCNSGWKKEDEYFRDVLVDLILGPISSDALDEMRKTIARAEADRLQRGLRQKVYDVSPQLVPGRDGLIALGPPMGKTSADRLTGTLCRSIVALHWWHTGARLPNDLSVFGQDVHSGDLETRGLIATWFTGRRIHTLGRGALQYAYETDPNDSRISFWAFLFYKDAFFHAATVPDAEFYTPVLQKTIKMKPIKGVKKIPYKEKKSSPV